MAMNYRIDHNPRCSGSRAAKAVLPEAASQKPFVVRDDQAAVIGRPAGNAHGILPA